MDKRSKSRIRDLEKRNEWIRSLDMPIQMKGAFGIYLEQKYPTSKPNSKYRGKALFNIGHDPGWRRDYDRDKHYEDYAAQVIAEYLP